MNVNFTYENKLNEYYTVSLFIYLLFLVINIIILNISILYNTI